MHFWRTTTCSRLSIGQLSVDRLRFASTSQSASVVLLASEQKTASPDEAIRSAKSRTACLKPLSVLPADSAVERTFGLLDCPRCTKRIHGRTVWARHVRRVHRLQRGFFLFMAVAGARCIRLPRVV